MGKPLDVGGQAVLEGVMMRGPKSMVIAVRRPDGEIVVKDDEWIPYITRWPALKWPLLRGAAVLVESLVNGMQALSFSAEVAIEAEEEQEHRREADAAREAGDHDKVRDLEAARAEKKAKGGDAMTTGAIVMSLAFSFAAGIALFIFLPHWAASLVYNLARGVPLTTEAPVDEAGFHALVGLFKMAVFTTYVLAIARLPDIRRVFQYHGAEHKSIWTWESGEELTIENARRYPVQHPRCGTSFLVFVILVSIGFFAAVFPLIPLPAGVVGWKLNLLQASIKIPMMIPIAGISYEFIKWAGKYRTNPVLRFISWPGLFVQNLTTREPTDEQLEVALVSVKRALELEGAIEAPDYANCSFLPVAAAG